MNGQQENIRESDAFNGSDDMADIEKVIEDLGTAIMCVNNMLTQKQFIVRDKVVNAMIQAINTIEEQRQQIIMLVGAQHGTAEVIKELQENE